MEVQLEIEKFTMLKDALTWLSGRLFAFRRDENGAILLLSLMLFVGMVVFGGLAVDLANHERTRTTFQTHLDNAVLAAASLSQALTPEETVMSYMTSAGLDASGVEVETSTETIGNIVVGRTVYASMDESIGTYFFRFFNYDTLEMKIESQATERVEDIEISLVLDVSGSMGWWSSDGSGIKINALKTAASDFVDAVLSEAEEGRVSISIIPYAQKVNVGADLLRQYNATQEHSYSNCVDFSSQDFNSLAVYPETQIQRTGHFRSSNRSYPNQGNKTYGNWVCRTDPGFKITPLSSSATDLKADIQNLYPDGTTSIEIGAKWGLALLDPSAQEPVSALVSEGLVHSAFRGRPHPHNADNNMKVLIIMTDGENTEEQQLRPGYIAGESDVFKYTGNGGPYYNVLSNERYGADDGDGRPGEEYFYASYPEVSSGRGRGRGRGRGNNHTEGNEDGDPFWNNDPLDSNEQFSSENYIGGNLTWAEVWAEMSPFYYAYNMRARQLNNSYYWYYSMWAQWNDMIVEIGSAEKDTRLRALCNEAHQAGIVTYTIGMDVTKSNSLEILKDCASTEAHYFDVKGMEIQAAFDMIAASISMLRLTK